MTIIEKLKNFEGDLIKENEMLRDALADIARQRLTVEMENEAIEDADFQGGYDRLVEIARKALQPTT